MGTIYSNAFKALNALNEDAFELDDNGIEKLKAFRDGDTVDEPISIIDADAETEDELQDSYIGKVILDCLVCHSKIYKDKEDIEIGENGDVVNEGEDCPYCYSNDGFKVVGVVAPLDSKEDDDEDKEEHDEDDDEDTEDHDESFEESMSQKRKPMRHSCKGRKTCTEAYYDVDTIVDATGDELRVFGAGINTNDALLSVIDKDGKSTRLSMGDVIDFYDWYYRGKLVRSMPDDLDYLDESRKKITEAPMHDFATSLKKSLKEGQYRGAKNVQFVGHGEWSDPDLVYKGYTFNYWDIENALWDMFLEDTGHTDSESGVPEVEAEFDEYVRNNIDNYLDDVIYGGYFSDGSKSWRDKYESLKIKRSAKKPVTESRDKKPVEKSFNRLTEGTDPIMDAIGKHFDYAMGDFEFYDVIKGIIEGIGNLDTLQDEDLHDELDNALIYRDDIRTIWLHYNEPEIDDETYERFYDDVLSIINDIRGRSDSTVDESVSKNETSVELKEEKEENPLEGIKDNVFEFPSGDYVYVGYKDGKLFAGGATNVGVIHETEVDYDHDATLDSNLQRLYDAIIEEHPEYLGESLKESLEVKTEDGKITVVTDDEKVTVEKNGEEVGEETIEPVPLDVKRDIEDENEVEVDIDDFDDSAFDELGEKYMRRVYENVNSYETTSAKISDGKLVLEGVIEFSSGNKKKTSFVFESKNITKDGKVTFLGENKQISRGKKAFTVCGTLVEGKLSANKLGYDYTAKGADGKSKRIYGTVSTKRK